MTAATDRMPRVGDTVRVRGGDAPVGKVVGFASATLAKVVWDGWCESLAVVPNLEIIERAAAE